MTALTMELLKLLESAQDDEVLEENAGNLKGLPPAWFKKVMGKGGGQNSQIEPLETEVKNISKFRTTIIDAMKKDDGRVGVFVKVDGDPFAVVFKEQGTWKESNPVYEMISADGSKLTDTKRTGQNVRTQKRDPSTGKRYHFTEYKSHTFEVTKLPMSKLLPKLVDSIAMTVSEDGKATDEQIKSMFKNNKIEFYTITVDAERGATSTERKQNRAGSVAQSVYKGKPQHGSDSTTMDKDLSAAEKKFIKTKLGSVNSDLEKKIQEQLKLIQDKTADAIAKSFEGETTKLDFSAEMRIINDSVKSLDSLASAVASIFKKGMGNRLYRNMGSSYGKPSKNYDYEWFSKVLASLKGEKKND